MTTRDFCFWLQGYYELTKISNLEKDAQPFHEMVQQHLSLVFKHDPSMTQDTLPSPLKTYARNIEAEEYARKSQQQNGYPQKFEGAYC